MTIDDLVSSAWRDLDLDHHGAVPSSQVRGHVPEGVSIPGNGSYVNRSPFPQVRAPVQQGDCSPESRDQATSTLDRGESVQVTVILYRITTLRVVQSRSPVTARNTVALRDLEPDVFPALLSCAGWSTTLGMMPSLACG